jgi:hypothetical protein
MGMNLISEIKRRTYAEGVGEYGAEKYIWT